jgi:RNase adaptor protein for sRNA GlmZ degradation
MTVELVSFGYGHGDAPRAHLIFDVREHFRDPAVTAPALRSLTAEDDRIASIVFGTPGIDQLTAAIESAVLAYLAGPTKAPVTVAIGCVGGRHRSVAIAAYVARRLADGGAADVRLTHRDIGRPVIERAGGNR